MRKLVRVFVALAVLALGVVIVPPAQAAPAPPKSYTPPTGAVFNNPAGSSDERLKLMNQVKDAVDSVPSGSVIRFVVYSFDWGPMATALITAHQRGVNVRLLIDSHTETPEITRMRSDLKKATPYGNKSYLKTCTFSCMSSKKSFIHSKLYLFSRVGNAKYVSMISSANPAVTGINKSWNNTYTIAGDKTIYDANVDNFNDMLPDKTNTDYYHTVESGNLKEYFFPRAGSTKTSDTLYNILNDVSCPSTIRLTTYFWTSARLYLAQKLAALKTAGCNVEVIYPDGPGSQDTIYPEVTDALLKGNIPTYNTRPFEGLGRYVHNKVILIGGTYQGVPNQQIVYATSQNLTMTSLRHSNEVMLRIPIPDVYAAYVDNFKLIKANSDPVTRASETAARLDSSDERVPRDNSADPDE